MICLLTIGKLFVFLLQWRDFEFLANVNSRSRSLNAIADPSVGRLSVTLVRPTQPVEIFGIFYLTIAQGLLVF